MKINFTIFHKNQSFRILILDNFWYPIYINNYNIILKKHDCYLVYSEIIPITIDL
ncbi:MAG: hypothetical protein BAJALOKI2v1_610019 [Promethearchaeota archaeon]|nr:MAG: hypothetical protein BAJALOKI2v1_610019 [Candidatus Lokiarchaeota archaeon]